MNNRYAVINGTFVLEQDAKILISDLAIQRGYGIFDYFRVGAGPVFLEDHLDRFYRSAAFMGLPVQYSRQEIIALIMGLTERNKIAYSGIRITLTGGYSENGYLPAEPNLLISQAPFHFDETGFEKGTSLVTYNYQRQLASVKTTDYLQSIYLQPFIREHQADDVLYHAHGAIRECPRANFFVVTEKNELITPADDILKGITRKKILELPDAGAREAIVQLSDLHNIREAFITSTTKVVLPVLKIDGVVVGNGKPGELTRSIYHQLLTVRGSIQ